MSRISIDGLTISSQSSEASVVTVGDGVTTVNGQIVNPPSVKPAKQEQPTLRDQFAMAALQGIVTEFPPAGIQFNCQETQRRLATLAKKCAVASYVFADAMLAAREAGNE